jgi:N-acyl-D-amino-acid deacylase
LFDLLIMGGRIVDGTGNPWFRADVGVLNGRIEAVGRLRGERAERVIDATGLVVAPGFIDMHSHGDLTIFSAPEAVNKLMQGVTTEVVGNCGFSLAPLQDNHLADTIQFLSGFLIGEPKPDWEWRRMREFMERAEAIGMGTHKAQLVGHGTVRTAVMGFEQRDPTDEELEVMKRLVAEAMEDGAVGLSTGLIYPPGSYAKTEEIIQLARVAGELGGIYASHIRGESDMVVQSVEEAIRIGEESGAPTQISHLKVVGKHNWGRSLRMIMLIDEARRRGVEVTGDQYPYTAGSSVLTQALPPWVLEGGIDRMIERLRDPATRRKVRWEIEHTADWENIVRGFGWENIYISYAVKPQNKRFEGKSLKEVAEILGKDPYDTLFDLLIDEEGGTLMVGHYGCEEDLVRFMKHPAVMMGTDMWNFPPLEKGVVGAPHPRGFGALPRVLGHYARERGLFPLEEAVRKMTSAPALKLGLKDRGLVREGYWADLTLFDPDRVIDRATYQAPAYPEGIEYVILEGIIAVDRGRYTGARPGRFLKPDRYRQPGASPTLSAGA